ncbi:DNA repair protein RAD5B [Colletotrichum siamense]|nr:DNA repair protein RAD5B [Colletotrichum siamense]
MPPRRKEAVLKDGLLAKLADAAFDMSRGKNNDLDLVNAFENVAASVINRRKKTATHQLTAALRQAQRNTSSTSQHPPSGEEVLNNLKSIPIRLYDSLTKQVNSSMLGDPMELDEADLASISSVDDSSDEVPPQRTYLFDDASDEDIDSEEQNEKDTLAFAMTSLVAFRLHRSIPPLDLQDLPAFVEGFSPHSWQLQGAGIAREMCESTFRGVCIADPMGYGKTLTTLLVTIRPKGSPYKGPVWIVAPKTLVPHWEEQFQHFHETERPSLLALTDKMTTVRQLAQARWDYIIITPQFLTSRFAVWQGEVRRAQLAFYRQFAPAMEATSRVEACRQTNCIFDKECWDLFGYNFPYVIYDEVHGYKNDQGIQNEACVAIEAKAKILVSGTPLKNKVTDAFGILKILPGNPFASRSAFLRVLDKNHGRKGLPKLDLRKLAMLLDAVTISRPHAALNLPELIDHDVDADLREETVLEIAMLGHKFHRLAAMMGGSRARRPQNSGHGAAMAYATRARLLATSQLFDRPSSSQKKEMEAVRERFYRWCHENEYDPNTIAFNPARLQEFVRAVPQRSREEQVEDPEWRPDVGDIGEDETAFDHDDANINNNARRNTNRQSWLDYLDENWEQESERLANEQSPRLQAVIRTVRDIIKAEGGVMGEDELDSPLIYPENVKIVLFSEWVHELDVVEKTLAESFDWRFKIMRFDGTRTPDQRQETRRQFQHREGRMILLATVGAGGQGISLTACHHVVLIQPLWTIAEERQALARCHRQGQEHQVHVWRINSPNSVMESHIRDKAEEKNEEVETVMGLLTRPDGSEPIVTWTADEMESMAPLLGMA